MEELANVLDKLPWFAWVAIVAIIGSSISSVFIARFRHAERMAMIANGLDPSSVSNKDD